MKFDLLNSETVYTGRAFNVRRDEVRIPNSRTVKLDVVDHVGSISIVPVDDKGQVYFVRQYRHPAGVELLELPAGTLEPGELPLEGAAREIREEIGQAAANLQEIGHFYLAPGYSTELMHVFLATGLSYDPLDPDADEFLDVVTMPAAEAFRLAENGELLDAKSLASLLLARPHIS